MDSFESGNCWTQSLADLPESYDTDEGTNSRRAKDVDDVLVLVKEYISSTTLGQKPLLVMVPANRSSYPLTTRSCFCLSTSIFFSNCMNFFFNLDGSTCPMLLILD